MSKAIQAQVAFLDSNISTTDDEIIVRDLNDIYDNQVVFVDPIMYFTIEPLSSTNQEIISCTGIEVVSDTKVRLTGVVRHLAAQPGVAGTPRSHGANQEIILTNNPQFYDGIAFLDEAETITEAWDFEVSPTVPNPTTGQQAANRDFVEGVANQGAADASTTTKGISRLSASPTTTLGTATVTVASPAVVTLSSHGLTENDSIQFTTTGALPTGLLPSVTYYVIAAGLTSSEFELSLTLGGVAINTTGTQSGVHTLYKTTPVAVGVNDTKMLTQAENDAAAGAGGSPSSSNLFETQYDTSNGSTKTATTISFAAGTKTISDSGNGFVTAGFKQGTQITITGSASNNGTFTIVSVAAGAIVVAESLVNESAGATVVMTTVSADKLARANGSGKIDNNLLNIASIFQKGGTGSDGALTISSGTTNIDLGGASIVVKNYTSISITSTGALTFTNPSANGTCIIFRCQGNVAITSSANPVIDLRNLGSAAGTAGTGGGVATNGNAGTDATVPIWKYTALYSNTLAAALKGNLGTGNSPSAAAGAAGTVPTTEVPLTSDQLKRWYMSELIAGFSAGGGGGAGGGRGGSVGSSVGGGGGAGGRGAGCLIIESAGTYTFTTGTINAAGANGSNATATVNSGGGGGGGGGGAGGLVMIFGGSIVTSGTVTVSGGNGGNGSATVVAGTGNSGGAAGGGGGSNGLYAGGAGGVGGTDSSIGASNPGIAGSGTGAGTGGTAGGGGSGTYGGGNTFGSGGGGGGGAAGLYITVNL